MKRCLFLGLLIATTLPAYQISLVPGSVIGFNGMFSTGYLPFGVLDQQTGIVEEQSGTYWINRDGGPADAWIVIDLGAAYRITSFDLFNTHNSQGYDRGTGNFTIEASNAVQKADGAVGYRLDGVIRTLAAGTLLAESGDPITAQSFTSMDTGAFYRYIRFSPHSVSSYDPPCCGSNVYGLSELRVFSDAFDVVPEPAAIVLLGGGLTAIALWRRRMSAL